MHVAICIVGFRNPDDVAACLRALADCAHADFEVVICENGGADAFAAVRKVVSGVLPPERPVHVIFAARNDGYAAGVNACMAASPDADAWWILNPDTAPAPPALGRLAAKLADGFDAVGSTVHDLQGRVESRGGRWIPWLARAVSLDHGQAKSDAPPASAGRRIDYLSGASMLVGPRFLTTAGSMREDYFLYGEEVEWCLRAGRLGLRLGVAADANVMHRQGTTTGSVSAVSQRGRMAVYLDERNKLLITRDRYPELLPVTALGALAMILLRFARRGAWRQLGYALDGWRRGLANERGKPGWIAD